MQKIFIKRFVVIMLVTVGITLIGNFLLQTMFSRNRADKEALSMIENIDGRIKENEVIIEQLVTSLNENYIARANALAQMIAYKPEIIENDAMMQQLADTLNVEEVHVTDENGVLRWGNVEAYKGLDFAATDQTRPFMPGLADKSFALAQEPQPNGSIGRLFQYISVARQDKSGIVQVGVSPEILENALSNNKIDAVIQNFNVSSGVSVVAINKESGLIEGSSDKSVIGMQYKEIGITKKLYQGKTDNAWIKENGRQLYAVLDDVGEYRIGITFTWQYLLNELKGQTIAAGISSILLGLAIIIAIFVLLKRMVISGIESVNKSLGTITAGNLDVVVDVDATPEFVSLSHGINQMTESINEQILAIKEQAAKLQEQTEELNEQNENILASLQYARKIQINLLPPGKVLEDTFSDYDVLWKPRDLVGGDIYWMKQFEKGKVLCVCDCTGHGTPGALLTMLVVTALNAIVGEHNCDDPAAVLWELDQKLASVLNVTEEGKHMLSIQDGADLVILCVDPNKNICMSSAKMHLFTCDGSCVEDLKGQKLSIGDDSIKEQAQIKTVCISANSEQSYYIVSDGLFEQVGGERKIPFGYRKFKEVILKNHGKPESEVVREIWREFEEYMGEEEQRDDITLVGFRL